MPKSSSAWPEHWAACAERSTLPYRGCDWRVPSPGPQADAEARATVRTPGSRNANRLAAAAPERRAGASHAVLVAHVLGRVAEPPRGRAEETPHESADQLSQ